MNFSFDKQVTAVGISTALLQHQPLHPSHSALQRAQWRLSGWDAGN